MVKRRAHAMRWLKRPQEHDYPAAASYLSLLYPTKVVARHVKRLKSADKVEFKSKDIFRASGLPLLDGSDSHVAEDQKTIKSGEALSPILLVRDPDLGRVVIADGYHRLCAVYSFDEDAAIPCRIV
jgi:hypothetical protein